MAYDTATNTFRGGKAPNKLPARKERKQLPGGFSRPMNPAKAIPPSLPQATNTPKGQKRPQNVQKNLPPE